MVDAYIDFHGKQKRNAAVALLDIIQNERQDRNDEVSRKHQRMIEFRRENEGLVFGAQRDNVVTRQVETLLTQLSEAQLATIQAEFLCQRPRRWPTILWPWAIPGGLARRWNSRGCHK